MKDGLSLINRNCQKRAHVNRPFQMTNSYSEAITSIKYSGTEILTVVPVREMECGSQELRIDKLTNYGTLHRKRRFTLVEKSRAVVNAAIFHSYRNGSKHRNSR